MKVLPINSTGALFLATVMSISAVNAQNTEEQSIQAVVAKDMLFGQTYGPGYKWQRTHQRSTVPTAKKPAPKAGAEVNYVAATSAGSDSAALAADSAIKQSAYKWGIRSAAEQNAYKWGIRSAAVQNAYKWGIRSAAEQNAYKWGIRSAAEQNAYKWGIRSATEQKAYKWGIRSAAEQNAYKWGIRSATEQKAYKWGIRSSAQHNTYKWGIR